MERTSKVTYRFTKSEIKEALIKGFSIDIGKNDVELILENSELYRYHGYLTIFHDEK